MNMEKIAQRLHDSRIRSAAFAAFGGVITFAAQAGFEPLTHVQPWVKQFAIIAMLVYGLMAIAGFVAGAFLNLRQS
jgi:hypothetical protein